MTTPSQLRTQLQTAVIADLLGPANGPEEIVDERTVRDRYLVGKLGPKGQSPLPEADDPLTVDDVMPRRIANPPCSFLLPSRIRDPAVIAN